MYRKRNNSLNDITERITCDKCSNAKSTIKIINGVFLCHDCIQNCDICGVNLKYCYRKIKVCSQCYKKNVIFFYN